MSGSGATLAVTLSAAQGCRVGSWPGHRRTSASSLSFVSGLLFLQLFLKLAVRLV